MQATDAAVAAVFGDCSIVTWGADNSGGDSRAVQVKLKNVQQIQSFGRGFAVILGDGSVVTWGTAGSGSDSSAVQDQLKSVQQIQAPRRAFAAILATGGDSSTVRGRLTNVKQI